MFFNQTPGYFNLIAKTDKQTGTKGMTTHDTLSVLQLYIFSMLALYTIYTWIMK